MYRVQTVLGRQMLQRTETPRKIPASAVQPQHSPLKVASAQVNTLYSLGVRLNKNLMVLEVRFACTQLRMEVGASYLPKTVWEPKRGGALSNAAA